MMPRYTLYPLIALCLLTGCATSADKAQPDLFPTSGPAANAASVWLGGGQVAPGQQTVESSYVEAEQAFWAGDTERAFGLYLAILEGASSHPLARFVAVRVQEMNDEVVGWHERVLPVVARIKLDDKLNPMTAVALSNIAQRAAVRRWSADRASAPAPFDAASMGLPQAWMVTPRLSAWRQLDMTTSFLPERERALAVRYLSPAVAEDVPINYLKSRPFVAEGVNLSPKLGAAGVYYMETFASVAEGGDYWVYGNFAGGATLWIDGQEVLTRGEEGYETGKRLRRVRLDKGVHRVLLKLSYQPGYRDWFDMVFLRDGATALDGSALTFSSMPPAQGAAGEVKLLGAQRRPAELEPLPALKVADKNTPPMALYLEAQAALYDYEPQRFDRAANALAILHPRFAPGHALRAQQVLTLWELPGRQRDAVALQALRAAQSADPDSVRHTLALGEWLKRQDNAEEARRLLERAYQGAVAGEDGGSRRVRHVKALHAWASYLEGQSWDAAAEQIWAKTLELEPADCAAANRLQGLLRQRQDMRSPATYSPKIAQACPAVVEAWVFGQAERREEQLEIARAQAARYPWRADYALQLVRQLVRQERADEADKVLAEAIARMPWETSLRAEEVQLVLAREGAGAATLKMMAAIADNGMEESWLWMGAAFGEALPLVDLLQDGPSVARKIVEESAQGAPQGDEAIYIIDFAAKQYLPDGSGVQITHTMVRLMTKNAIDEQAEVQIPRGAKVIHARTIKQDGTVRAPEEVSGKETLSMPGLAEGDFIEVAYVQFDQAPGASRTQVEGTRFFFRMADISSKRSEFVLIDPPGEVLSQHGAPKAERFTYNGRPALRFVRTDSPRPRAEPAAVAADEYLPWVQLLRVGTSLEPLAVAQRSYREALRDGMRNSAAGRAIFAEWIKAAAKLRGQAKLNALFHAVTEHFPEPSPGALSTELAHALATKQGSPVVALKALYDQAKIPAEIYLARPRTEQEPLHPMLASSDYTGPLIRAQADDGSWVWLDPSGQEAMFGAIPDAYFGQPALCLTCESPVIEQVPLDGHKAPLQAVSVTGELSASGDLAGEVIYRLDGVRAVYVRELLRQRVEEGARAKLADALLADVIPGAAVKGYVVEAESALDEPVAFKIQFVRPQLARAGASGGLEVEVAMFREPLASQYGALPARTVPLQIGYGRERTWSMSIKLPSTKAKLISKAGQWSASGPFGEYQRAVELSGDQLTITSALKTPAQRVAPKEYAAFRQWAIAVEQSSYLAFVVE